MIAVVGPLTSLAVGVVAPRPLVVTPDGLLARGRRRSGRRQPARRACSTSCPGCRSTAAGCSSAVWQLTGNMHRGTIVAGWGGRVAAVAVLAWPLLQAAAAGHAARHPRLRCSRSSIAAFLWSGATAAMSRPGSAAGCPHLVARDARPPRLAVPDDLPLAEAVRRAQEAGAGGIVRSTGRRRADRRRQRGGPARHPRGAPRPGCRSGRRAHARGRAAAAVPTSRARTWSWPSAARPPSEYLLVEADGSIFGVLATADVDRAFRGGRTQVRGCPTTSGPPPTYAPRPGPASTAARCSRGVGAAGRRQGPPAQHLPGGRQDASTPTAAACRPRRPHRARGGLHDHLVLRRRVPRLPAAALRVRRLDAARRRRRLPQGRRPDRRARRHLPGRARRRGRRRVGRADLLAAARGRALRPRVVVRAPRGVRRRRPPQRRAVLRRPRGRDPPGLALTRRRPRRGAARVGRSRQRGPGHPGHARALGVPRRRGRRAAPRRHRLRVRRDHHPAVPLRGDGARARRLHRAAGLGVAGPRLARRGARRTTRPQDDRPHRRSWSPPAGWRPASGRRSKKRRPAPGAYGPDYDGPRPAGLPPRRSESRIGPAVPAVDCGCRSTHPGASKS